MAEYPLNMQNVFVVIQGERHESSSIWAIFTNLEAARAYVLGTNDFGELRSAGYVEADSPPNFWQWGPDYITIREYPVWGEP